MTSATDSARLERVPAGKKNRTASDSTLFFRKFLERSAAVGTPVPSSEALSRAFVGEIDDSRPLTVVELGAGTGAVTGVLRNQLHPASRLLVVEREPEFCEHLERKFPELDIACGDALDLEELLSNRELPAADLILGEIPVHWLSAGERRQFLSGVARCLNTGGTYRQLSFMPWWHRRIYAPFFRDVSYHFVLRNLPPAGFYCCRHTIRPETPADQPCGAGRPR